MRLTVERSRRVLASHGCYVTEACDKCGTLLGAVRYIRRGESGEWCYALCRDGIKVVAKREARKAGRPRKHGSNADRQRACRARRPRALRNTLGVG
jgi:hypothetical protein